MANQRISFPSYPFVVDLKIKNDAKYTALAYVVDKPQFIKLVAKARTQLVQMFPTLEDIGSDDRKGIASSASMLPGLHLQLDKIISYIRWEFSLPISFYKPLEAVILYGSVKDDDFTGLTDSSASKNIYSFDANFDLQGLSEWSTDEEVLSIFRKQKNEAKAKIEALSKSPPSLVSSKYSTNEVQPDELQPNVYDTQPALRKTREWYHLRCKGFSLTDVSIIACKEDPEIKLDYDKSGKAVIKINNTETTRVRRKVDRYTREYYSSLMKSP